MDVAAAADQHVVGAPADGQAPGCIEPAEIAAGQPAIGVEAAAVGIAAHQLPAVQAQAAVGSDGDDHARQRPADQPVMPGAIGRAMDGDQGGRFAHPVARPQRPAGLAGAFVERARQGGAADQRDAQAGRRADAGIEQGGQHRRHQRDVGDRIAGQVVGHRRRLEAIVQQLGGTCPGAAPEDGLAADVIERQAVQPEVVGAQAEPGIRRVGCGSELAGAEEDGTRPAFAAAGRDDQRHIVGAVARGQPALRRLWPEGAAGQTAGPGVAGQRQAVAAAGQRCPRGAKAGGQMHDLIPQGGMRPLALAATHGRGLRPAAGRLVQVLGKGEGGGHGVGDIRESFR